jgi:hypothetical protein
MNLFTSEDKLKKYENVEDWSNSYDYVLGDYASYDRDIYQYIGTQSSVATFGTQSISPVTDIIQNDSFASWTIMTEWKILDYLPIQTLNEFRTGTHSYNFTVDSNIDPFVVVEVTSDNGYGQIYTSKKNYEIRGTKDLVDTSGKADPMGPFESIVYLEDTTITNPVFTIQSNLPDLTGGQSFNLQVTSDQTILRWEVVDLVESGCNVTINLIPVPLNSKIVQMNVLADPASGPGVYAFKLKAIGNGGTSTISELIIGIVYQFICPTITLNGGDFSTPVSLGSIENGLGITVAASSNLEVYWEIINVTTNLANVTIDFSVENVANCIILVQSDVDSPSGDYSFQIRAVAQANSTCIATSGVISGSIYNPSISNNYYSSHVVITANPYTADPSATTNVYDLQETNNKTRKLYS